MTDHVITPMRPYDRSFVFASWKAGYRDSPEMGWLQHVAAQCDDAATHDQRRAELAAWHKDAAEEAYDASMQRRIERLLTRSRVLVARPPDWPEGILGWVCSEQTADTFLLHWAHVRKRYRARYTGHSLLWELVAALEPRGALRFTYLRPPFTDALTSHGYAFAAGHASAEETP